MSYERPEESSRPPVIGGRPPPDNAAHDASVHTRATPIDAAPPAAPEVRDEMSEAQEATPEPQAQSPAPHSTPEDVAVLVRGQTVRDQDSNSSYRESQFKDRPRAAAKIVLEAKVKKQSRLPALDDDQDVGVQRAHVVTRDGKPDLAFTGTLLASAAPASAPKGKWDEYRVYETSGGKHVFSKVTRRIFADEHDTHAADVFDPSPSSVSSQLLRSARDLTRTHPMTWTDAAASFFGYDPLAKALYRKLSGKFEEHIS